MTYERQIATAQKLLKKFGGPVTYTPRTGGAALDANKPWRGVADNSTPIPNVPAAFLPVGTRADRGRTQDQARQLSSDKVYIAAADIPGVTCAAGDTFVRDGSPVVYNVNEVDVLNVNGEPILFTLFVGA